MLDYQASRPECGHTTVVVISDIDGAGGLEKATRSGVTATSLPLPDIEDRTQRRRLHEEQLHAALVHFDVELIILSGYMRLLTASFVDQWAPRIINIHPSLLPAFPGAHAHRDVLEAGAQISGCTVHYVDAGMDTGQILGQRRVPVFSSDTERTLGERVKVEEHRLYPQIIDQLASLGLPHFQED